MRVEINSNNMTITDQKTNALVVPFKDGQTITGVLKDKSANVITVDFDGQQMDIRTNIHIGEKVGDNVSFKVEKGNNSWSLIYQNNNKAEERQKTQQYDNMKQGHQTLNQKEKEQDDEELTIYNYSEKLNEAIQSVLRTTSRETLDNMKKYGYNIRKVSVTIMSKLSKYSPGNNPMPTNELDQYIKDQIGRYEKIFGDEEKLSKSVEALSKEGLIVTEKNTEQMIHYQEKLDQLAGLDQEDILHLLKSEQDLSVDNMYKTMYSGGGVKAFDNESLPESLIMDYLTTLGYEASQDNITLAKTFIANEIAVTQSNMDAYNDLQNMQNYINENEGQLLAKGAKLIHGGHGPGEVLLYEKNRQTPLSNEKLKEIMSKLPDLSGEQIGKVLSDGKEVNLKNLIEASHSENLSIEGLDEGKVITFTRQLNEIRLKMTLEAAGHLNQKGISIDTTNLSELVDHLKELEQQYYANQLDIAGAEVTKDNVQKLDQLYTAIAHIKDNMEISIGAVHKDEAPFTIQGMKDVSDQALKMYDALGTKIDTTLGDGFNKIKGQIGPLLEDLGVEVNEQNLRSAAILIKNQMDVTMENLEGVTALDKKVQEIINHLHPQVAAHMLKENLDPMTLHVDELRQFMNSFNEKYGETIKDQVPQIIAEMDKSQELTPEERQGMISVYRMLHAIDKNRGQAVGFLMKENMSVTLENLLEASKYFKSTGLRTNKFDTGIDDEFGFMQDIKVDDNKISEGIKRALEAAQLPSTKENVQMVQDLLQNNIEFSQANMNKYYLMDVELKNHLDDLLEELKDQLQLKEENNALPRHMINDLSTVNRDFVDKISSYGIEPTLGNLKLMKNILENPFEITDELGELNQLIEEDDLVEYVKNNLDQFKDNATSEELLDDLKEIVEDIQDKVIEQDYLHHANILDKAEKIGKMAAMQKKIQDADNAYQIPIYFNGEITSLNMYVLGDRQADPSMEYDQPFTALLAIKTANMGIVQGRITMYNDGVDVSIHTEQQEDMDLIKGFEKMLKGHIEKAGFDMKGVNYSEKLQDATNDPGSITPISPSSYSHSNSQIEVLV